MTKKYLQNIILVLSGLTFWVTASASPAMNQLEQYVEKKAYKKAYTLAQQHRATHEGDPRFDYLYGLAALNSGRYNEAVFALERVTASEPGVIRPRLELARAYLKMNNHRAARREFTIVKQLNPPQPVRNNVDAYLDEINKAKSNRAQHAVVTRQVDFSVGYDDNINFGYDDDAIDLPFFGQVLLDPTAVKQGSGFAEAKGQINYRKSRSSHFNHFTNAALTHREYFDADDFNLTDLDLRTGFTVNRNQNQYQLVFRARPVMVGGDLYSTTLGVDAAIRNSPSAGSLLTGALSIEDYSHDIDALRDRTRLVLGGKWDKKTALNLHQVSAYIGTEEPDDTAGEQHSRDLAGAGYRLVRPWNARNKSFLKLDYQHSQHQAPYAIYPDKREDDRIALKLGHEFKLTKKTDLIMAIQHINNDSNLALYDTVRNEVKVGIRYEW